MADWLVADVGASHTRVARATRDGLVGGSARRYGNAGFAGLAPLLGAFLDGTRVDTVCAGVAGPVRGGTAQLTNLDWFIDAASIARATGAAEVHLINDLQAQGYGLDDLPEQSILPVLPGGEGPEGARMVMGLGTGSNIAVVHRIGTGLFVPPAEAGHGGLPHLDNAANAVIAALGREIPHKPNEAFLSGPGLARLHRIRCGVALSAPEIVAGHLAGDDEATRTLGIFAGILGAVTGNLALAHMATGGVFLIGGAARAVAPHLVGLGFHDAFVARGPYREIMEAIPVHLVTDDHAALLGCTRYLRQAAG